MWLLKQHSLYFFLHFYEVLSLGVDRANAPYLKHPFKPQGPNSTATKNDQAYDSDLKQ